MKTEQPYSQRKIVNDPVHGFISIPDNILYSLIEHPYIQRLRRIKQLGLTSLVYPGAVHTRFQHTLGAFFLMGTAISVLRNKGCQISENESTAAHSAIIMHDIGHGPFSHALEQTLIESLNHEDISLLLMDKLNVHFKGALSEAIDIFKGNTDKLFLHQLVSSQLDMDRLDYLKRDSFFSGVSEGVIGSDRIIKMLEIKNNELVVEGKGIYSIEKFLVARRLMYWQVYLHKTALVAERMLIHILKRAKDLALNKQDVPAPPFLKTFLEKRFCKKDFLSNPKILEDFIMLDDNDIMSALKQWRNHRDPVLAKLSSNLLNRRLLKIEISDTPYSKEIIEQLKKEKGPLLNLSKEEMDYFVFTDHISNSAYNVGQENINILYKDGTLKDISRASDMLDHNAFAKTVNKYILCYPK
ncbi:HD domain-containing protein [Marinilabilia rubra]|uniref:Phosphohydrolase n=1 Tax=Marinilabilia rubra TaxID=2162893 RepID=A0A2U2B8C7_9BACT|nr:HD domain-containing protein [Marinilabilia rubra]PWD99320.1 phosphohydrolase [Marinilabilia rubra]